MVLLVLGAADNMVCIWDPEHGVMTSSRTLSAHGHALAYTASGLVFVASTAKHVAMVFAIVIIVGI